MGKSDENLNRILTNGQKVLITGKVEINDYKDKEGVERKIIDINVDSFGGVELLGNKAQQESETDNYASNNNDFPMNNNDDMTPVDDDSEELPF